MDDVDALNRRADDVQALATSIEDYTARRLVDLTGKELTARERVLVMALSEAFAEVIGAI